MVDTYRSDIFKAMDILKMISKDMEQDAKDFDGQPFTGKTMAEYNGKQGAAITALADILILILEKEIN